MTFEGGRSAVVMSAMMEASSHLQRTTTLYLPADGDRVHPTRTAADVSADQVHTIRSEAHLDGRD
jgi:hypothetical protein